MTNQFTADNMDSGAPNLQPSAQAQQRAQEPDNIAKKAGAALEEATVSIEEAGTQGYRTFFAARQYRAAKFLIKAGTVVNATIQAGMPMGIKPVSLREGDVWAKFSNSVLVTDDPAIIAWCENHPKVCRDANDKRTAGWAALKEIQVSLNNREVMLPADLNVDDMLFPDLGEAIAAAADGPDAGATANAEVAGAVRDGERAQEIATERAEDTSYLKP